ncbi:hypothetical protein B488_07900 [Liberibacter crescens BT-1]|uniref:DUF1376 domain-containing protein n=1 Tax=Liberibacter crescens (strain BT-1) TaxID=1215343 RepID=L0EUZ4_LIBCB|nr:YdaU family protein [Liberibacter crescens]AGA64782.1 hypothetical protein B488_07900 [Liberibacter crescens BT-1]
MNSRPWYKRYPADFISGVLGLTLEEKGAYSIILDLIYDRGGPIPDNDKYLAGVCGCSIRKWRIIRGILSQAGKIYFCGGYICNARAEKELLKALKATEERIKNGQKGGKKSAEMRYFSLKNNNFGQGTLEPARAFQKPEARIKKSINEEDKMVFCPSHHNDSAVDQKKGYRSYHEKQDIMKDSDWRQRLLWARRDGFWPEEWGPAPGQSGCHVPDDFLKEEDKQLFQGKKPPYFSKPVVHVFSEVNQQGKKEHDKEH